MWKQLHRATYLDEIIRLEGRADFRHAKACADCLSRGEDPQGSPEYRCVECYTPNLVCISCCLRRHRMQPLHRIEVRFSTFLNALGKYSTRNGLALTSSQSLFKRSASKFS